MNPTKTNTPKKSHRLLAIALGAVIALSPLFAQAFVPGMQTTARGATKYFSNLMPKQGDNDATMWYKQITFNDMKWYIIKDDSTSMNSGTLTLLAADNIGKTKFHEISGNYSTSFLRNYLDNLTKPGGSFEKVAGAIQDVKVKGGKDDVEVDAKLYALSLAEAKSLPSDAVRKANFDWWLRSRGPWSFQGSKVVFNGQMCYGGFNVDKNYGIRPALKLKLDSISYFQPFRKFEMK